jgi:glutathione S-transferase
VLAGGDYLAGDAFSAADLYLGAQLGWGMMFKTVPTRPAFEAYVAKITDRPAYHRARAIDNELIAAMKKA